MAAYAATTAPVEVGPIRVAPETTAVGQHPRITAQINRTSAGAPQEPLVVNVIAVVVLPDNIVKSWTWTKVSLARRESKEFSVPAEYDSKLPGIYKVEFHVYSTDMRRRFATRSTTFSVTSPSRPARREAPLRVVTERNSFGIGIYGNALNPAGGATVMLWPFRNVGLQGTYTAGTFTSYEARLLVKLDLPAGFNPYIGAGYLSVSKKADIIGITTEFRDRNISGVAGVEIPLGRRVVGYAEVSGVAIDLQKVVTNGAQTVKATAEYAPVTIGAGIVYYLF